MSTSTRAKILADSIGSHGIRLTTVECCFPRIILAQVRTYGRLAYSVRSSRAVPVQAMIDEVRADPFVPAMFRKVQKGMVAGEIMPEPQQTAAIHAWRAACDNALDSAESLARIGTSKEHANRLLEPFSWSWAVITGDDEAWEWLFKQRCAHDAQPEFQELACAIRDAMKASDPKTCDVGDWHTPYAEWDEVPPTLLHTEQMINLSSARCARVSYKPFDGASDIEAEFKRAAGLTKDGHLSPFEHASMCCATKARPGKFAGWLSARTMRGY